MDGERRARAHMEVLYDKLMARVGSLEDILGASNNRPRIAEEIDNKLADVQSKLMGEIAECKKVVTNIN